MLNRGRHSCPVCNTVLQKEGDIYSIYELFKLWTEVSFSKETIEEHRKQSEYTQLYLCPACMLGIYLPPIIGTSGFYLELLKHETCYFYSDEKWDFNEAIKDIKNCKTVMEFGCGPGNFLEKIHPFVDRVYGTEYNEQALLIARKKGLKIFGANEKISDALKGQVDIAFSFHVLEHVADPVGFINEMFSWVKQDGKVGISVPNMNGPVKYIHPCISNMPPHHATHWTLKTFQALARTHGYKVERYAFEPLTPKDRNYYTEHWIQSRFPRNTLIRKVVRRLVRILLSILFKVLFVFGKRSTSLLKGQSIYVLLSKEK
jgi:2-polyprenyl-3-methyl-5-hydroxy-6-metoxy-1,4-benzoquinol methylase